MIGKQDRSQRTLFIPGSLDQLVPDDHTLKRVDKVLVIWGHNRMALR